MVVDAIDHRGSLVEATAACNNVCTMRTTILTPGTLVLVS